MWRIVGINLIAGLVLLVDQLLKQWFLKNSAASFGGDFFYELMSFHLETNAGIAFGLAVPPAFLAVLLIGALVLIGVLLIHAYQRGSYVLVATLTLVLAGALSNVIDRLRFGSVIDYIDLRFFTVFNLADVVITISLAALTWYLLVVDRPKRRVIE